RNQKARTQKSGSVWILAFWLLPSAQVGGGHAARLVARPGFREAVDAGADGAVDRLAFPAMDQALLQPHRAGARAQDAVDRALGRSVELSERHDLLDQ